MVQGTPNGAIIEIIAAFPDGVLASINPLGKVIAMISTRNKKDVLSNNRQSDYTDPTWETHFVTQAFTHFMSKLE